MSDQRREGDERPFAHEKGVRLTWTPEPGQPFRWLPRHGEPSCVAEWIMHQLIKGLSWLPVYTAIIVTVTLIVVWVTR